MGFDLNYLDDNLLILDYQAILRNPASIWLAFREDAFLSAENFFYRPLYLISFILNSWSETAAWGYRLVNLLLHLGASCLVLRLLLALGQTPAAARAFAVLFALHPANVNTVALLSARNESLLALLAIPSTLFFIAFVERPSAGRWLGHLAFWIAALLTKESAAILPALCVLFCLWIKGIPLPKKGLALGSWLAVGAAWLGLRRAVLGPHPGSGDFLAGFMGHAKVLTSYLGKATLPFDLPIFPELIDMRAGWGVAALALLGLALRLAPLAQPRRVWFGAAWFFLLMLPTFALHPESQVHFMSHRLYLPLIGVALAWGEPLLAAFSRLGPGSPRALAAAHIVLFAGLSAQAARDYRDRFSFWKAATRDAPLSAFAYNNLAAMHYLAGDMAQAEAHWKQAKRLNPNQRLVQGNLGLIYMNQGRHEEALRELQAELRVNPNYDHARYNMGLLFWNLGQPARAADWWKKTLEVNPYYQQAYQNLAAYYSRTGDSAAAKSWAEQAKRHGIVIK